MFACLIEMNGLTLRSSFHSHKDEAMAYAERSPGVIAVEEIGEGVIWERDE